MKSFSEIETTSKRASRAIGFSWGVAEEVGKNIRFLELFGFPGVQNLNEYYKKKKIKNFQDTNLINQNNKIQKYLFCPINLGVNFLDQIKKIESFKKCSFQSVAYPLLFLPFVSRASEIIGKKILFKIDKKEILLNFNINISSNFLQKKFPSQAKYLQINFLENKNSFNEKEWKNLYKLSEDTFVEESESLKQSAAGAGLTDND